LKELTLVLKPNVLKRWTKDRAFVIDDLYSEFFLVQNVDIIRFQVSKYHDPIPYLAFFAAVVGERTNHLELDSRARRYCGDGKLTYQLARLAAFPEVVRMLNLDEEDMERFPNARWTFTHFGWDRYERAIRARRKQDSIDFSTKLAEMP
jgi:hypothetical protein